jgi:hypothetical protein
MTTNLLVILLLSILTGLWAADKLRMAIKTGIWELKDISEMIALLAFFVTLPYSLLACAICYPILALAKKKAGQPTSQP